jgi:hypothetical protein
MKRKDISFLQSLMQCNSSPLLIIAKQKLKLWLKRSLTTEGVELRKSVKNLDEVSARADEEKKHKLSAEFDAVQLKSSSHHRKAEVEVMAEEKPDYTKVELQKSVRNLDEAAAKANEEKRHKLSAEFDAVNSSPLLIIAKQKLKLWLKRSLTTEGLSYGSQSKT